MSSYLVTNQRSVGSSSVGVGSEFGGWFADGFGKSHIDEIKSPAGGLNSSRLRNS